MALVHGAVRELRRGDGRGARQGAGGVAPQGAARSPGQAAVAARARRSIRARPGFEPPKRTARARRRSEEHTSELQSRFDLVCRLLLEKNNAYRNTFHDKVKSNIAAQITPGTATGSRIHSMVCRRLQPSNISHS